MTETTTFSGRDLGPGARVLVVGTGAIGGFYGGKLAQAGAEVAVVCRSDYEAVKRGGIAVESIWGDFHFTPSRVIRDVRDYHGPADLILVGLKVLPEIDVARIIAPAVGSNTAIFLLQNGIAIEEPVAAAFPDHEIISGLAFVALSRPAPGRIRHQAYGRLVMGNFPRGISRTVQSLCGLFDSVQVPCEASPNVVSARWGKLVWNAAFNPISVLGHGAHTKAILANPNTASLARGVMREVCDIAAAAGHILPDDAVEKNIAATLAMGPFKTSMLQDFEAGRPMEIEAILGNAVRIARNLGVAAVRLESLYALMQLVQAKED